MNLNRVQTNSINTQSNYNNKKAVAFTATLPQILEALKTAKICPGKAGFLESTGRRVTKLEGKLFSIEGAPDKIVYNLGEKNEVPKFAEGTRIGRKWKKLDDELNEGSFECHPGSTCGCGDGFFLGGFAKKLLNLIGVEEPDVITVSRPTKKQFNFLGMGNFFK